jgi:hypothetical protein
MTARSVIAARLASRSQRGAARRIGGTAADPGDSAVDRRPRTPIAAAAASIHGTCEGRTLRRGTDSHARLGICVPWAATCRIARAALDGTAATVWKGPVRAASRAA